MASKRNLYANANVNLNVNLNICYAGPRSLVDKRVDS